VRKGRSERECESIREYMNESKHCFIKIKIIIISLFNLLSVHGVEGISQVRVAR
jgi:hypothetical protein